MTNDKPVPSPCAQPRTYMLVGAGGLAALFGGAFLTSEEIAGGDVAAPQISATLDSPDVLVVAAAPDPALDETPADDVETTPERFSAPPPAEPSPVDPSPPPRGAVSVQSANPAAPAAAPARSIKVAQIPSPRPEIVVKFKDETGVKEISELFWKDKEAARAKFDALKAQSPALRTLRLDRVTYSGEMVLVHEGGMPKERIRRAMQDAAQRLKNDPNVSYAEPNATAQPGAD